MGGVPCICGLRHRGVWLARGILALLATMGVVLAVATLPAAALAAGLPVIESLSASHFTQNDATLEAQINPGGFETTYEFHVTSPVCQSAWPVIGPCFAISVWSLPGRRIPAGPGDQTVSLDLNNAGLILQPGTWYEYAVTASNAAGTVPVGGWEATEQDFKTLSANTGTPSIVSESATSITEHNATLEALINPQGLETTYEFWLAYADCQHTPPGGVQCESISQERVGLGQIAAGDSGETVRVDLSNLQPNYSYSYWVTAISSAGETDGHHQTFRVLPEKRAPSSTSSSAPPGDDPFASSLLPGTLVGTGNSSGLPSEKVIVKRKPRVLTDSHKLVKALRVCDRKQKKKQRARCKKQAEKQYDTASMHRA